MTPVRLSFFSQVVPQEAYQSPRLVRLPSPRKDTFSVSPAVYISITITTPGFSPSLISSDANYFKFVPLQPPRVSTDKLKLFL
jgi:hypothetical protein